jgi:hypothetical protein
VRTPVEMCRRRSSDAWELLATGMRPPMSVVKSLWASIQGDPVFMRRVNGWLTVFWIVMIPVSIFTGWISEVAYVAALSLWALVSGHWSAWQAARVEVQQAQEMARREKEDLPGEIVERVVEETEVEKTETLEAASAPARS